jgi:hypothetical protein
VALLLVLMTVPIWRFAEQRAAQPAQEPPGPDCCWHYRGLPMAARHALLAGGATEFRWVMCWPAGDDCRDVGLDQG